MTLSRRGFLQASAGAALARWSRAALGPDSTDVSLCHKLASDPLRPQYHLLPSHNWMNDPNGPIYFRGRYHMFHQYNPRGATWGNMHWAHATSLDMIHWQHEGIALCPTPNGPDSDGVFSGSSVIDKGKVVVIYTGVAPPSSAREATLRDGVHTWRETQCLAEAEDADLRSWKKTPQPVITTPPAGLDVTGFRDPALWREGNNWMLILGSGIRGKGGMILLYTSTDLRHWTYLHPLIEGPPAQSTSVNPVDTGEMWECPDFFPLDDKYVLLISTMGKVRWMVGRYANQRFAPENEGVVDWGSYYAAKTMVNANGRRILWGWIPESRSDADLISAGWAGAMSLPRVLSLDSQKQLESEVATDVRQLRTTRVGNEGELCGNCQHALDVVRIKNFAAEIEMDVQPKADDFTLRLYSDSGDLASLSWLNQAGKCEIRVNKVRAPLPSSAGSTLQLHMFLDGSVLETFANGTAVTARIYQIPSGPIRLGLEGNAKLVSLNAWEMQPISKDRLAGDCTNERQSEFK
jgi:beta-fructofuranosidase